MSRGAQVPPPGSSIPQVFSAAGPVCENAALCSSCRFKDNQKADLVAPSPRQPISVRKKTHTLLRRANSNQGFFHCPCVLFLIIEGICFGCGGWGEILYIFGILDFDNLAGTAPPGSSLSQREKATHPAVLEKIKQETKQNPLFWKWKLAALRSRIQPSLWISYPKAMIHLPLLPQSPRFEN